MNSITWSLNNLNTFNINLIDLDQVRLIKNIMAGFPIIKNITIRDHNYHTSMFLKNEINGHVIYYLKDQSIPQFLANNGIRYDVFVITFINTGQGPSLTAYLFNNLLRHDLENNQITTHLRQLPLHKTEVVPYSNLNETITMNMPCIVSNYSNSLSFVEHKLEKPVDVSSVISFLNFAANEATILRKF